MFDLILRIMKKSFTLLFCSLLCIAVAHGEVTHSLSGTVLTISGTGAMQDYTSATKTPWKSSLSTINRRRRRYPHWCLRF